MSSKSTPGDALEEDITALDMDGVRDTGQVKHGMDDSLKGDDWVH